MAIGMLETASHLGVFAEQKYLEQSGLCHALGQCIGVTAESVTLRHVKDCASGKTITAQFTSVHSVTCPSNGLPACPWAIMAVL